MSIPRWTPSQTLSARETKLLARHKRSRKLFVFLRLYRHELFDDAFQAELESIYRSTGAGKLPCPPALLAMAMLLQGYERLSDSDAVEHTASDARWQMVLDRMGEDEPAFAQSTLVDFRTRLISRDMDRRILERTVELAKKTGHFDYKKLPQTLRVAVDSAPLQGAGRVEDTINLMWHAARKIVELLAALLQWDKAALCQQAGIPLLLASSAKAALDVDWSQPQEKERALDCLIEQLESLVIWLSLHHREQMEQQPIAYYVQTLKQVIEQDLEPDPNPTGQGLTIREGVAKDRRISVEDAQMRHGRKSKSQLIDGYKRHVAEDLDTELILACAITPANRPEREATPDLEADLAAQNLKVAQLQIDQAYLDSSLAESVRKAGGSVLCRPRVSHNGTLYRKQDFAVDLQAMTVTCPGGQSQPIQLGKVVHMEPSICGPCPLRSQCTDSAPNRGRSLSIALDEPRQQLLRGKVQTPQGRAELRQRVSVEHRLSHIVYRQGDQARYLGLRKNLFDLRRASIIQNLETIHRVAGPDLLRQAV